MAKPLFHDIVPPDRKSIKKIPIPERSREKREVVRQPVAPQPKPIPRPRAPRKVRRSKVPVFLTLLALGVIVVLVFIFIPKATGATITLTPRGQNVSVNATFTAQKDISADLPYQVAVYEKDGKLTVPANGEENAQTKASGVIRIFNNFSSDPQKLIANTRFATAEGLIFRITQPIVVPGLQGSTPGSIDAAVTAEQVGANYNVGLADFTIPGFKGDARYSKIFARSKTTIDGGFSGTRKKVDGTQVTEARQKIRNELQTSLIRQMKQNIPENFVFPQSAYFIEYQSLPDTLVENGVVLAERATFHGIMFKRTDLAHAIAIKVSGVDSGSTTNDLANSDSLIFSSKNTAIASSTPLWDSLSFGFLLNGTTTLISAIDTEKLKAELRSKPRTSLNAILAGYPGIAKAEVTMRPFWKQSFPDSISEISIDVVKTPIPQ
jgi:hypothetical protein